MTTSFNSNCNSTNTGTSPSSSTKSSNVIPVIDILLMKDDNDESVTNNADEVRGLAAKLVASFRTVGFATLINHGIDTDVIMNAFRASECFFNELPLDIKMKSKYSSHQSNRGYIPMGHETHGTGTEPDRKETFDIGKEYGDEDGYTTPWPSNEDLEESTFKNVLLRYYEEFNKLNLYIMKLIGIGLKLDDPNFFVDRCNNQHCNLRLLHYPELDRRMVQPKVVAEAVAVAVEVALDSGNNNHPNDNNDESFGLIHRGAEHRDYGTITLLTQDMTGGLRVQLLDGSYTFVDPVPNSIIINVGEMLQRWTNDYLIANPHQVVDPPTYYNNGDDDDDNNNNNNNNNIIPERFSIAFFCNANKDVLLVPMNITDDDNKEKKEQQPFKYEPITAIEYITQRLGSTIAAT